MNEEQILEAFRRNIAGIATRLEQCSEDSSESYEYLGQILNSAWVILNDLVEFEIPEIILVDSWGVPPIYYDKNGRVIIAKTKSLVRSLVVSRRDINVDVVSILFFMLMHELGHHQLHVMGVEPRPDVKSSRYLKLYSKFEDYAISRVLRGDTYRRIEQKVLSFSAIQLCRILKIELFDRLFDWHLRYLARTLLSRYIDYVSTVALVIALGYLSLREIVNVSSLPDNIVRFIQIIADDMTRINRNNLLSIPSISYESWMRCLANT